MQIIKKTPTEENAVKTAYELLDRETKKNPLFRNPAPNSVQVAIRDNIKRAKTLLGIALGLMKS